MKWTLFLDEHEPYIILIFFFEVHENVIYILHFNDQATTSDTPDKNPGETKTMEATTPTRSCWLLESKILFLQR